MKIFAFLIVIFTFYFLIFNLDVVRAADYIFGTDSTSGDFTIREKGGNIKLRIDSSGNLDAPIKGLGAGGENLLPNGSFENDVDSDGIPNSWSTSFQTTCSGCSYTLDTTNTNVRDGVKSLALGTSSNAPNTDTVTIASDTFAVTPGKTYTASIDVIGNFSAGFSLKILYYLSSGTASYSDADAADTTTISNNAATTSSWTNYSGDFTVPSTCGGTNNIGCTRARLLIIHSPGSASSTRYFDNAKVAVAQSSNPFNASNVSSGAFGSNTGGGNYSFPANVGIGTTGPGAKLDVSAAGNNPGILLSASAAGGYAPLLEWKVTNTATPNVTYTAARIRAENSNNTANDGGVLSFWTATEDASHTMTQRMWINAAGTLAGTSGTALTNLESRAVGQHLHSVDPASTSVGISDPGHNHQQRTGPENANGVSDGIRSYTVQYGSGGSRRTDLLDSATTGISASVDIAAFNSANAGSVAGTNAPYIQLLACQKS